MHWTRVEARTYWQQVHSRTADDLAAVCAPGSGTLHNRYSDYAHRLGMQWAFRKMGVVRGKQVLDIGTGRGRWSRRFAAAGACVVALDVSHDALMAQRHPRWERIVGAAQNLPFGSQQFDVVCSVTVIQHIPHHDQETALGEIARVLRPGGQCLLFEFVGSDEHAPLHMMPRSDEGWMHLAEAMGLRLTVKHWAVYEPALRVVQACRSMLERPSHRDGGGVASTGGGSYASQTPKALRVLGRTARELAAIISWPLEPLCFYLRIPLGTHVIYIFRKDSR